MKKQQALDHFGGNASKLARLCGITPQAVHLWPEEVHESRQYELEVKTQGALKSDYTLNREQELNNAVSQ